jgi:cytoskeletal protein CcmA (bactofilin family)
MFGKEIHKLNSLFGPQSEFKGDLAVKGLLRVEGSVKGKIQADQLILSATAEVEGDLQAKKIIVGGRVVGKLKASELVEILAKGRVKGDVFTDKLLVVEGGEFNGRIEMNGEEQKVLDYDSRPMEASAK